MALFGGSRDARLIAGINKELINCIINTEVVIYQIAPEYTATNIYGESTNKAFFNPIRFNCLITREDPSYENEDEYLSYTKTANFAFLLTDLTENGVVLSEGDLIKWDSEFYEISLLKQNQLWAGKNPETHLPAIIDGTDQFGLNVSIIAEAFKTTKDRFNIESPQARPYSMYDFPTKR